jgi:hypothetical protein
MKDGFSGCDQPKQFNLQSQFRRGRDHALGRNKLMGRIGQVDRSNKGPYDEFKTMDNRVPERQDGSLERNIQVNSTIIQLWLSRCS